MISYAFIRQLLQVSCSISALSLNVSNIKVIDYVVWVVIVYRLSGTLSGYWKQITKLKKQEKISAFKSALSFR